MRLLDLQEEGSAGQDSSTIETWRVGGTSPCTLIPLISSLLLVSVSSVLASTTVYYCLSSSSRTYLSHACMIGNRRDSHD